MPEPYPVIRDIGLTGMLVTFADALSDPANNAALVFRAAVEAQGWQGVEETATSLASTFLRFDPLVLSHDALQQRLAGLLQVSDWYAAPLPTGRTLWRIPVVLGGTHGPQFDEAATAAGFAPDEARAEITRARVRVLTIGFAPGQAYMGQMPPAWDVARMKELNPQVPGGALVTAIRQLIIFAGPAPTGWRHIGQTAFECFRPGSDAPFALTPGDEVMFREVTAEELEHIRQSDVSGDGGATREALP